jgi:signal transduction histidine kinase
MEVERVKELSRGEVRHFRHATWPVADAEGRVQQVVKLVEDITNRKALEAEAVHAGKLSALGKMAAAVAHEINNPLASLSSRISLMERSEDPGFIHESLAVLRRQIARMGRIVHTVSQFGRAPMKGRSTWDVNAAVEEALSIVKLDPRAAKTHFVWQPSGPSLFVSAVRDQIVQAYLNVLINAVEAMPDGGRLSVRVFARNGDVGVAIEDSGKGIDEAVEARLFEPFATTKPSGTGIGLAISQSLVRAHGGRIEVRSEHGKGSCFTVLLPEAGPTAFELERGRESSR